MSRKDKWDLVWFSAAILGLPLVMLATSLN
jgi:hypothetical protein